MFEFLIERMYSRGYQKSMILISGSCDSNQGLEGKC